MSEYGLITCRPHIVYVLVDDWGWANVGYHRDPPTREVSTPNIDKLVRHGLELDQHYAFKLCSPSRCSLLTGRLPIHVSDNNKIDHKSHNPKDPISGFHGIPRNMTVIARKMKEAGYITHQIGKWDAGMATPTHTPHGRGFDSSLCYFHHDNDYFDQTRDKCGKTPIVDLWGTKTPAFGLNQTGTDLYEEGLFKERVLDIVANHDTSKPLFLYYATHAPHDPYQVPDSYLKRFKFIDNYYRRVYQAMVTYVDDVIGELVTALKKKGMWENLLLVVTSDNGGPVADLKGGNNYPLKGGKASDWQGGIRVNAFVAGGYLPSKMQGRKSEGYIHIADWYSTFCSLGGVDPKDKEAAMAHLPPIDSLDMWPLISGQNATSPRTDIPVSYNTLISGDFKIVTGAIGRSGWTGPSFPNGSTPIGCNLRVNCADGCLFNIKRDPTEHYDLATLLPGVLMEMQSKLAHYQSTHFNPERGSVWPGACDAAINRYRHYWGPFLD